MTQKHRRKLVKISGGGLEARGSEAVERVSGWGGNMARAEHERITGVWEQSPSGVQGQSPWSGGQGAKPP